MLALLLGGFAAYWLFMPPPHGFAPLTLAQALNLALYAGSCGLILLIIDRYQRAVARLRQEDANHLTLAREQGHRVSNALAVVEAIVQQSLRGAPEQARMINQRIRSALAGIDLGDRATGPPMRLGDLLTAELEPYDLARFDLQGEDEGPLTPESRNVLALAVHELATNALKHGALSVPDGGVTVAWRTHAGGATISWREAGGPPVQPPKKRGYGSVLLRRLVEGAGGAIAIDFRPTGLAAEISLPSGGHGAQ
jgi:two-component sensor histidine kinase